MGWAGPTEATHEDQGRPVDGFAGELLDREEHGVSFQVQERRWAEVEVRSLYRKSATTGQTSKNQS